MMNNIEIGDADNRLTWDAMFNMETYPCVLSVFFRFKQNIQDIYDEMWSITDHIAKRKAIEKSYGVA